jgi:hypothetical protein
MSMTTTATFGLHVRSVADIDGQTCATGDPEGKDFNHDTDDAAFGVVRTVSSQSKTTWCSLDITPSWQCSPPPSAAGKRWYVFSQQRAS